MTTAILVLDLDVLADDYFIRFQLVFDSEEMKYDFIKKSSSIQELLVISDHEPNIIGSEYIVGLEDMDQCILHLESFLRMLYDKSVSEIYEMVHNLEPKFFNIMTLPLDD